MQHLPGGEELNRMNEKSRGNGVEVIKDRDGMSMRKMNGPIGAGQSLIKLAAG